MTRTTVLETDFSGQGESTVSLSAEPLFAEITVTTRGSLVRQSDSGTNPRLTGVGYWTWGNVDPDGPSGYWWLEPLWVGWDQHAWVIGPMQRAGGTWFGFDAIKWNMLGGSEVHLKVWNFS
jgi:hypothetical protein